MTTEQELIVAAPKAVPFVKLTKVECWKCGNNISRWDRFTSWLLSRTPMVVTVRFCEGGQELTRPAHPIDQIFSGKREDLNTCAGLNEPHLHLKCRCCGDELFMQTRRRSLDK